MQVSSSSAWQPQIASTDGVKPTSMMSPPPSPLLHGTLDGVANMLSMPPDELRTALSKGASVADLAASKGIDKTSIVSFIEQQVQARRAANGRPPIDPQVLARTTERAVDRHRSLNQPYVAGPQPTNGAAGRYAQSDPAVSGSTIDVLA